MVGSLNRVVGERRRPEARRGAAIDLSAECLGWAQAAHYVSAVAEDGDVQLRSMVGAPSRYFIRRRGADRLELTEAVDGDDEHPLLFVAELGVLERHLIGLMVLTTSATISTSDSCGSVPSLLILQRDSPLPTWCAGIAPFGGLMALQLRQRRTRF